MKLQFKIQSLVRVLKTLRWSRKRIERSALISLYQTPLKYYVNDYVYDWIAEALGKNGRIFES